MYHSNSETMQRSSTDKYRRFVALPNTDYKILKKKIASRIEDVLPDLISHEQTRYLKGDALKKHWTRIRSYQFL